ncbi:hypothetical protein DFH06DRAFT_1285551 [Mycena polygramma]|nr:hypothetical protein DFH06DRAFT_1285551 [Mycena polygramma]
MQNLEQDRLPSSMGEDDLPTYDDLAAQEGPNSRFGRWRGWIEKRAAERYLTITPEERARRRERGWGNEEMDAMDPEPLTPTALSIQTQNLRLSTLSEPPPTALLGLPSPPLPPLPPVSTALPPSHLKMHHFGSRFLPHASSPIRCLLPLQNDQLLLVGHDEGLSVLDMYPQEWTDNGGIERKGPEDAAVRAIWEGEGVFQMSILEQDGGASGVVLMLVGPEPPSPLGKDGEAQRTVRMYNLASLVSLAKWAVANKGANPLNLGTFATQQATPKKHRPTSSIARGLKSLIPPSSSSSNNTPSDSYQPLLTPQPSTSSTTRRLSANFSNAPPARPPPRSNSDESSWELLDAPLPVRWARDFVPLAGSSSSSSSNPTSSSHSHSSSVSNPNTSSSSSKSRLLHASVLHFALWTREEGARTGSRGQWLAVAITKGGGTSGNGGILLYETPVGERAFRFVKEFYTPLQPKSMSFFQQTVHDVARSPGDVPGQRHRRTSSNSNSSSNVRSPGINSSGRSVSLRPPQTTNYGTQLSIFVVFEKKAGWIRLADSAVGEMELLDVPAGEPSVLNLNNPYASMSGNLNSPHTRTASVSTSPGSIRRKGVSSEHGHGHGHGHGGSGSGSAKWLLPVRCELPAVPGGMGKSVYVLTRGATSHVVPCPLPSHFGTGAGAAAAGAGSGAIGGGLREGGSGVRPLAVLSWRAPPTHVAARVGFADGGMGGALGIVKKNNRLSGINGDGKGKGKARADDVFTSNNAGSSAMSMPISGPVRAEEDPGGETGYLCVGGHWDDPHATAAAAALMSTRSAYAPPNSYATPPRLQRTTSSNSGVSIESVDSEEAERVRERWRREEGVYGWCRKGVADWRVFWVGGSFDDDAREEEEE